MIIHPIALLAIFAALWFSFDMIKSVFREDTIIHRTLTVLSWMAFAALLVVVFALL